jgi:hypothetical protein
MPPARRLVPDLSGIPTTTVRDVLDTEPSTRRATANAAPERV